MLFCVLYLNSTLTPIKREKLVKIRIRNRFHRGLQGVKFSYTSKKNSKTACALHIIIIIDLIGRKTQLKAKYNITSHNLVSGMT